MMTLGERLREVRKRANYTLRDVALRSGISIGHQSDIERDAGGVSVDVLERLADSYGLTLSELLEGVRVNGPMKLDYSI